MQQAGLDFGAAVGALERRHRRRSQLDVAVLGLAVQGLWLAKPVGDSLLLASWKSLETGNDWLPDALEPAFLGG